MVGDGAGAREVFRACDLVREHRRDQVLGLHALDVRRDPGAAAEARESERDVGVPPPAHLEHRCVEERLGQDIAHRLRRKVAGDFLEREAVGLAERKHDRVLGRRRLQLEVELAAEALAQRQAPGPVETAAEPGVDDELHPAAFVEEPLEHHCVAVGQGAEGGVRGTEVVDDLCGGGGVNPGTFDELPRAPGAGLRVGGDGAGRFEPPREPPQQVAYAFGQLIGASRRLAEPEGQVGWLAVRVLHSDRASLDAQDAPRGVAELEDVAGHALDREVLVDRAEASPVRLQHHVVVGVVRDRAARGHRGEAGAAPGAQRAVDDVAVQVRAPAPASGRESTGEHREQCPPAVAGEVAIRPGAAHGGEQGVLVPVFGCHHGHGLLRKDIERCLGHVQGVQRATPNRVQDGGALHQLVAAEWEQPALRGAAHGVTGTPRPLQEGRDGSRRTDLADQIDVPDVDSQLQRGGGHQCLQLAGLEPSLGRKATFARETAMVGGDMFFAERLGQRPRHPLRHAARIDEHERGAVRLDEDAEPLVDLGPDLAGHHRSERRLRQLQREVALALMADIDDGAFVRPVVVAAGEEAGHGLDRALGCGQPDAGDGPSGERIQAFERERKMGAALVAGHRVNLVDDGGVDAREHGAPALAGEQDVERLRRRHQDVRRVPAHGFARRARGIAGAHHGADARTGLTGFGERPVDAFERYLQVPVHVVAERLEGRDVEHAGGVRQRHPAAVPHQGVDGAEEPGQRLAGAGGGRDERMPARRHRLPCLRLARGGFAQVRGEPGRDGGVEAVEGHASSPLLSSRWPA